MTDRTSGQTLRDEQPVPDESGSLPPSPIPRLSRTAHDRSAHRRSEFTGPLADHPDLQVLLVTADHQVPLSEGPDGPHLDWRPASAVQSDPAIGPWAFLGSAEGTDYAVARGRRDLAADHWQDLRIAGMHLGVLDAGLLVEAIGLTQWHDRSAYCPLCGTHTELREGGWVRRCPADKSDVFPRSDPAMIVLVHDGAGRIVLGRNAMWPADRFSILAGFVEPGESAEAAVAREVGEEVGLELTDIRYVTSQPWPLPSSLMLGFTARAVGDLSLHVDGVEMLEAEWFSREQLRDPARTRPLLPPSLSISHHILTNWIGGEGVPGDAHW